MHTDKKLLCNRFFLNQQLEEDKKRERQSRSWSVYYLTLNIARSAASLTIGYLRLASVEIIRRWASRPATNAISVVHLSHTSPINTLRLHQIWDSSLSLSRLSQHARHEIRSAGFTSSQNSAHRNLRSHLLLSQIKTSEKRNSDSIRVSENDFDAHFHDRHQRRDCGWEERKIDRSSERERLAMDHRRRRRRRTTLPRGPAFNSVCVWGRKKKP